VSERLDQWTITLAALLHDVGKIRQRAGLMLPEEYWSQRDQFCPTAPAAAGGYHTHLHAVHTYGFLMELASHMPAEVGGERLALWAAKHHVPHSFEEAVVAEADWLSSGADRAPKEYEPEGSQYWAVAQRSVFDHLRLEERPSPDDGAPHVYGLAEAAPEALYPGPDKALTREQYADLWARFTEACRQARGKRPSNPRGLTVEAWLEAMLAVLERYCWCVPASTMADPDVSLADHAMTTAAFATALYRHHRAAGTCDPAAVRDRERAKFLLVAGDVSGIQQYIFDLRQSSVKGAAKLLRARSFEIQLLAEAAVRFLLLRCELPMVQNIMSAGGRFLLLLPEEPGIKERVAAAAEEIERWCLRRYLGQLSVIVTEPLPASGSDFALGEAFQGLYKRLEARVLDAKQRKHQRALRDAKRHWIPAAAVLDHEYDRFREANTCRACGVRPVIQAEAVTDDSPEAADVPDAALCDTCRRLKALGQALPHATRVCWTHSPVMGAGGRAHLEFFDAAVGVAVLSDDQSDPNDTVISQAVGRYTPGRPYRRALHFLPRDDHGEPLTFADMADRGRVNGKGPAHLAMLKMDVDHMGKVFREGLGNRFSISRYVTLSRMLDTFFSVCLHDELQREFPHTYTVFAGGDDLCVIGPWERTVELAVRVRERFREYTGGNPAVTLSAGLALAHQRLPVPAMAALAEEQLDLAKARRGGGSKDEGQDKDAYALFDVVVPWERWEKDVAWWRRLLDEGLRAREGSGGDRGREGYSKGLVRSLYWFREQALAEGRRVDLAATPWRAHLRYQLGRNIGGKDPDKWRRPLEELAAFGDAARERWNLLKVPVTVVLYHHRRS